MNWEFRSYVALSVIWASSLSARALSPSITVLVYNYAAIPSEVLAQTETEAARIYHGGSIEIQWLDCPLSLKEAAQFPACQVPTGPTKLAVRLLSQSMAERLRQVQDSLGFALYPENGGFATIANVFAHDAEQLADSRGMRRGVVLGHVLAHEVGHLLLGAGSHSISGIMHVPWRQKELKLVAQGLMTFAPAELEKMQTNISVRMAEEAAAEAVLVPRM